MQHETLIIDVVMRVRKMLCTVMLHWAMRSEISDIGAKWLRLQSGLAPMGVW